MKLYCDSCCKPHDFPSREVERIVYVLSESHGELRRKCLERVRIEAHCDLSYREAVVSLVDCRKRFA